jgi:hypothetical protein
MIIKSNLLKFFVLLSIVFLVIGCNNNEDVGVWYDIDSSNYIKSKKVENSECELIFSFFSNPYQWNEQDHMILYLDHKVVYSGKFKMYGILGTKIIKEYSSARFILEIIRNDRLYDFQNKNIVYLDPKISHVYIGLFPDNTSDERIHFIPQHTSLIQ